MLRPLPGVRAVLFDVYGTLFVSASGEIGFAAPRGPTAPPDELPGRLAPLSQALAAVGLRVAEAAAHGAPQLLQSIIRDHHERARRRGVDFPEVDIIAVFQELLRRLGSGGAGRLPADRRTASRLALEHELRANPTWPMSGAAATLVGLQRRGLLLGIVSNAQFYTPWMFPAHLRRSLRALGFGRRLCSWSYRCGRAKPSASVFLPPLRRLARRGIAPTAVLVVGNDRRNDVAPAAALGCRTALFAGDARSYRPRDDDPAAGAAPADLVLTHLPQLLEALPARRTLRLPGEIPGRIISDR